MQGGYDQTIGIISVGIGNTESISTMLNALGRKNQLVTNPQDIYEFKKVILPGVGNFGAFMLAINDYGFYDSLNKYSKDSERKILGLCVGAQAMLESSEESPRVPGFGWIKGTNTLISNSETKYVPRIGWDYLDVVENYPDNDFNKSLSNPNKFYFAHSYRFKLEDSESIIAKSKSDHEIPVVFSKNNLMGAQFHPEKSNKSGFRFLELFSNWI
jgi:imidazoleglycerol phosphate synthase glutamine amidotransferase subunit HisH